MSSAFVIPHYAEFCEKNNRLFIFDTLEGLFKQTDPDWQAIIIDDNSTEFKIKKELQNIKKKYYPQIDVIFLDRNVGPGICRNIGVIYAKNHQCGIIHFNDADDISHPQRVEIVKNTFLQDPAIGLIYSSFKVINEFNELVPFEKISVPILEIMETHISKPLEGDDVWLNMGTDTGYINKTSATSVRTMFAYECPFPNERASEDYHTWLRIAALGARYKYVSDIPTLYRIPSFMQYQASRTRLGPKKFNQIKARVDSDGFSRAIDIAIARNRIKPEEIPALKSKFYKRLAKSMERDQEYELTRKLLEISKQFEDEMSLYQLNL
jgi:glycosyltransferase involved in cell wall biosynthesis